MSYADYKNEVVELLAQDARCLMTDEDYAILWNGSEARTNMILAMTADDVKDADLMRHHECAKDANREWAEERAANEDMRRREGAWEDAGCPT